MSGGQIHDLAQGVLAHLRHRRWLRPGDRIGVAVSGGADSVALLRAMLELRDELGIVLSVVHFNHTLRGAESEGDHAFVKDLAGQYGLEVHVERGDVADRAQENSLSIEAAARAARYEFFWSLIASKRLDKIATAHTLDDQAETVLLRLIRGAGTRGMGGIQPQLTGPTPDQTSRGSIIRPLLHTRRREIEGYLSELSQPWREDSSNRDLRHTRNRVRQSLIPLLEKEFNPEITERLADFAEIVQAEETYWDDELYRHFAAKPWPEPCTRETLLQLPLALRRRLIRALAPTELSLEFRHVEAILEIAAGGGDSPWACNLPGGWRFERRGDFLAFAPPSPQEEVLEGLRGADFGTLRLPVPGQVSVPGTGRAFQAAKVLLASPPAGYNPEHLYAPHALPGELSIRTWRFGDRFWPAHTKAPKKLKELFQVKKIPAELRASWPVMVTQRDGHDELVWVKGFAAPASLRPGPGDQEAILLQELDLSPMVSEMIGVS